MHGGHGHHSVNRRAIAERGFQIHAATWFAVNSFLFLIWLVTTPGGFPWFVFPAGGWGIALAINAVSIYGSPRRAEQLQAADERQAALWASYSDTD